MADEASLVRSGNPAVVPDEVAVEVSEAEEQLPSWTWV